VTSKKMAFFAAIVLFGMMFLLQGLDSLASPLATPAVTAEFYLPMMARSESHTLVIDHLHTDINQIPDEWIIKAKMLTLHYAHTSHGGQIISGLDWLETQNAKYNIAVREAITEGLPDDVDALRIYDGNPPETYIEPDDY